MRRLHSTGGKIDPRDFLHPHYDILAAGKEVADRDRDLRRAQPRGGDLIEQRLENVVIAPVKQHNVALGPPKHLGRREAGESAADDHDARSGHVGPPGRAT